MDYIKLTDGTQVTIEDGASLGRIIHIAATEADALTVSAAITPANLAHVEFYNEGAETPYGVYDNLIANEAPTRQTNEDSTVTVTISLREPTELELRVLALEAKDIVHGNAIDALEVSDEMQNDVLDELLMG